ncbi:breast carcinoma-amplified sequence 1 isoform X7 [Pyxicephalus adspersus]|uniref:breast carcinoma-amplified sequence 1 isoform X7 n=1 Tax=Pyxicephalus adspersus TaxID=30357 RepID=UPI003B5CFD6B
MGNELSTFDVEEDQEESTDDIKPEVDVEGQNGPITIQSSPVINAAPPIAQEKSKPTIQQENVITSSQKTIIISPTANGTDTKPPAPPAKSKFRLTISRPAPGLTAFQPNDPENGDAKSEVRVEEPALIQTQKNVPFIVETNVTNGNTGPNQTPSTVLPTDDTSVTQSNTIQVESEPPKPKEISIFHRLFKPEKKVQFEEPVQSEVPENQEVVITVNKNGGLQSAPSSLQNVDKGNQAAVDGQSSEPESVPIGPETSTEATQTSPQPEIHPVMSFFKTLVNKPVTKSEEEAKPNAEDKQSKKDEAQTSGGKVVLEPSVVSVEANSEQSAPELVISQDAKPSNVPPQIEASTDDGKSTKEASARPRLFWRKGVEEPAAVAVNTVPEPALTIDTNLPEAAVQPQEEAVKEAPSRPIPFWRKSFKVDPQPPKVQENITVQEPVLSVGVEQSASEQPAVLEINPPEADKTPDSEKPGKEASPRPVPFWRKSFKGEPQSQKVQESVVVEQPVLSVSVNAEKSAPEQITAPDAQQAEAVTAPPENEKPVKEASTRPVPFWRKSFKMDPLPPKTPENSSPEEPVTIQLTEISSEPDSQTAKPDSGAKTSPVTEGKSQQGKKAEEGKNSKPKIMMFFKQLSVMGDPNIDTSEEINGKMSPTLDITDGVEVGKSEKTVVTAVVEPPPPPPPQKSKESLKEKRASTEKLNKLESREIPEAAASSQAQAVEVGPVHNGADSSKEGQMKRVEKRQSLGSFFKAIGPKRLCDAEVQTDPVSILPAEKAK